MDANLIEAPEGWDVVQDWQRSSEAPLFERQTEGGRQFIYKTKDGFDLEMQGWKFKLYIGKDLLELLRIADEHGTAHHLRVGGLNYKDFIDAIKEEAALAFWAMSVDDPKFIDLGRNSLGAIESYTHAIRMRLLDRDPIESTQSLAEKEISKIRDFIFRIYAGFMLNDTSVIKYVHELQRYVNDLEKFVNNLKPIKKVEFLS